MTKITITPHHSGFFITHDKGSDRATILAEHRRYDDALAAARLLARDLGLPMEAQPDARASMDDQTADALLTVRHHQTTLLTMVDDEVAEVFEPVLVQAMRVIEAALRDISITELQEEKRSDSLPPWQRKGGAK